MARPKEFNPADATREAMEAFWEHGYHGTSVNDLLADMNLNRGSLYGTFGDKKKLFLAALSEYERQGREAMGEMLGGPGSARERLGEWVKSGAQSCVGAEGQKGCLGLKAAMEMAPHDADVAEWLRHASRRREEMVAGIVERGQSAGEINRDLDPRAVAKYMLCCMAGLRIMGISAPAEREVLDVAALMLRALD